MMLCVSVAASQTLGHRPRCIIWHSKAGNLPYSDRSARAKGIFVCLKYLPVIQILKHPVLTSPANYVSAVVLLKTSTTEKYDPVVPSQLTVSSSLIPSCYAAAVMRTLPSLVTPMAVLWLSRPLSASRLWETKSNSSVPPAFHIVDARDRLDR
ncbi:hypothetical protein DFH29DRAFT_196710 [Suillus ampliporus]|nr:hypothetical protein DFH29DRAFT_196710 [Suillus ampliporus]